MNKHEMLTKLANKTGLSIKKVDELMDVLAALAISELKDGNEFTLPGLGKLSIKHREARNGRNPATGEVIHIAAKDVPGFTAAKAFKDAVA